MQEAALPRKLPVEPQKSSTFVAPSSWWRGGLVLMKNRCAFLLAQTIAKDFSSTRRYAFIYSRRGRASLCDMCLYVECVCLLKEASAVGQSLTWLTCCQTHPCVACEEERRIREVCMHILHMAYAVWCY